MEASAPSSRLLLLFLCLRLSRFFPLVGFSARINRRGDRFLLPGGDFLALLDQIFGALFQFPRFPLRVFASLVSLLHQKFAGFLARLRREQDADQRAEAQPYDEVTHFRSAVLAHTLPPCQASNRRGDRFLLPRGDFLALLDRIFRVLTPFTLFPLRASS